MPRAQRDLAIDMLVLDPRSAESLQDQLVRFFRKAIGSGQLRRGRALPSSRRLAQLRGISRTTVTEAYQRLRAEGYVTARPRAGLFVADVLPEEFSLARPALRAGTQRQRVPDASAVRSSDDLRPGVPALDLFPWRIWNRLCASVLGGRESRLISRGDPRGEPALREAVAEYLGTLRGLDCTADQVIIGNGSQSLVESALHVLARRGDSVWFEEPGDPASRAVLGAAGLEPVPVPVDDEGIDVAAGCRLAPAARLAIVAPSHHYPLGVTLSLARRRSLLEWAHRAGAWIIENEIDGDYRFVRRSHEPLHAMDGSGRVLFLGSFNKALAPGLRVGYLVVPAALVPELVSRAPQLGSPMVGIQQQLLLARFWNDGHLASYLRQLREVHAHRRELLIDALSAEADGVLRLEGPPEAGLRVPLCFDSSVPDALVVAACRSRGLDVGRPLSSCYQREPRRAGLCVGFAAAPEARIQPAVRRLVDIVREHASSRH